MTIHTKTMPEAGQFVAVWYFDSSIFSATLMWEEGQLMAYDPFNDDWLPECDSGYDREFFSELYDADYYQAEE